MRLRSNPEVEQFVGKSRLERVNEAQRLMQWRWGLARLLPGDFEAKFE